MQIQQNLEQKSIPLMDVAFGSLVGFEGQFYIMGNEQLAAGKVSVVNVDNGMIVKFKADTRVTLYPRAVIIPGEPA